MINKQKISEVIPFEKKKSNEKISHELLRN